ncbi:DUF2508 family protein [Paenibacillus thermoaerophilus]|uniref:DUF2508 family protein n=1 Tax=Paenibacillus thermoaerophilus TaxID=1215385 RepID=A0ABW2V3Y5_9BACL|nr:DUF2508 family protein [Paenibacillus thermoaerophilus]TMV06717.1 DUF2508 family protein [Paenibacillus thermoaerophilus]
MELQTDKRLIEGQLKKKAASRRLRRSKLLDSDKRQLLAEIRKAKREWQSAWNRFDYAYTPEQVDYAIYALGAAEKQYTMLIRQAEREKLSLFNEEAGALWKGIDFADVPVSGGRK